MGVKIGKFQGGYMEFKSFPRIPRLTRECIITEKIDGTNGIVYIHEDMNTVLAGSRNRWLSETQDNHGFYQWVMSHKDELIAQLGIGYHYGEWWGQGINKRYAGAPKTFSLFNTTRWQHEAPLTVCNVVPEIYRGPFSTLAIEAILERLRDNGSIVWPTAQAEGIVVYHTAANALFKKTLEHDEKGKPE